MSSDKSRMSQAVGWGTPITCGNMYCVLAELSVEMCSFILEHHHDPKNRPISRREVEKYCRSLKTDRFYVNGETIKFDVDGKLVDGQHRLKAAIEAGVPLRTWAIYNVERESLNVPGPRLRRPAQKISMYTDGNDWVNNDSIAVVRCIYNKFSSSIYNSDLTDDEYVMIGTKYSDEIQFVIPLTSFRDPRGMRRAPFRTVLICAMLAGVNRKRIELFCDIVRTGEYAIRNETERTASGALRLRDWMQREFMKMWLPPYQSSTARGVMYCLAAFEERRKIERINKPDKFIYPVPECSIE